MRTHDERNNGLREHSAFHFPPHPIIEQKRTETQLPPTVQTARPPRFIHSLTKEQKGEERIMEGRKRRQNKTIRQDHSTKLVDIDKHNHAFIPKNII